MKSISKLVLTLVLALTVLSVPFAVTAEAAPINWLPAAAENCTVVEGDGTVEVVDGALVITNNGDGDFRVTIDNQTPFDMTANNALHMQFNAEMPFKMAWHIMSEADGTNDWVNTSTDYTDIFELDAAADRSLAGEYDVTMDIGATAVDLGDKSSVYYEQFIILVTGKGTFTLNTAEMVYVESEEPVDEAPADEEPADEEPADDTATEDPADEEDTATTTANEDAADGAAVPWWLIVAAVIVVVVIAVVIVVIKKKK